MPKTKVVPDKFEDLAAVVEDPKLMAGYEHALAEGFQQASDQHVDTNVDVAGERFVNPIGTDAVSVTVEFVPSDADQITVHTN